MASLISVPLQNNFDFNAGPLEGFKYTLNVQPVIPISIGENWNMISRTIAPVISQSDVTAKGESEFGLGDIVQSLFFSPKATTKGGLWGIGPVFLLPTATDDALGIYWTKCIIAKIKGSMDLWCFSKSHVVICR